jgi:SAM-dependent methyltransferase
MNSAEGTEFQRIYRSRFADTVSYRTEVWKVLITQFFARYLRDSDTILDLGCGYGEFINNVRCMAKFAMDLNPDSKNRLASKISLLQQDCSTPWALPDCSLDVVFTSNFFEHLPSKVALRQTLEQAWRCLKPSGRLIAMGPNIRYLPGAYWDFWDHHLPLSHLSLQEIIQLQGFTIVSMFDRFLPYTLTRAPRYPIFLLRLYLRLPALWRFFGKQFVIVAAKPAAEV